MKIGIFWFYSDRIIGIAHEFNSNEKDSIGVVSGNGKYSTLRIFTPTSFNDIQHGIFA